MEGDLSQSLNNHGYLPDDMDFDSLINHSPWPTSTTPLNPYSAYQPPSQTHTPQNNFVQYQPPPSQASYQYDIPQSQHTSFHQVPYSNSPYSTQPQTQYQPLDRPSTNDYSAATFNLVDPSLHQSSSYASSTHAFSYPQQQQQQQQQQTSHATISPHSLYANSAPQLHQINRGNSHSPYQQQVNGALQSFSQPGPSIAGSYYNSFQFDNIPQNQTNAIQYPRIPNSTPEYRPATTKPVAEVPYQSIHDQAFQNQPAVQPALARPSSTLRVYRPDLLAKKDTELKHSLNHAPFVVFTTLGGLRANGTETKVPKPRKKSKVIGDSSLTKTESKKRGRPRKDLSTTGYQGTSRPPKAKIAKIPREDGSVSKSASPSETSSSEEDSSSEDESDDDEEAKIPVIDISTVRDIERPKDPALAAGWDAIGIIWKSPHQNPSQEVVSEAVSKYGQFIMGFRNQIKSILTKIEEANDKPAELNQLQKEQSALFDALYQAIAATLKHGAPFIVEQLGNHHQLVNALISTLRDCIKTNDYTGKLPKATLDLLARFKTLSDEILKKCKLDGVQKRWIKKGDKETNQKFIEIFANTVESQEKSKVKKVEAEKKARDGPEQPKLREPIKTTAATPAKRPLEDTANSKPTKKFAVDVSGNAATPAKPVPTKKPTANLLGIATRPVAKPVVKKREPSPPQESKLGALLASIAKPAEAPRAPSAPARPPETPEEKARRERKESRRHLRVKFKEGPELEQIKLFKHEQEEDEGRQDDMLRDATDMHNEGMMHKKRATEAMDLEDDDYQPPDVDEPVFMEPKNIDFSRLPKSSPFGPTYSTRGGDLEVRTPEQETQARREALELLVIYTSPEDIPPSAKEPVSTEEEGIEEPVTTLKQPSTPWHAQRLQELEHYGSERAFQIFATRVSIESPEERNRRLYPTGLPSHDLAQPHGVNTLQANTSEKQSEPELKALFDAFEALKGQPFPPTEPPVWMVNPRHRVIWLEGYKRDNPIQEPVVPEQQAFLPPPLPNFNPPPNMQAAQVQPPIMPSYPAPPLADIAQHMFAGFGNDKLPPPPPFDYNAWAAANNPQNQTQRLDPERSRREEDEGRTTGKKKKLKNWERFDENGEYKGPKLPCRFYAIGQCRKGADCTYSHDMVPQV